MTPAFPLRKVASGKVRDLYEAGHDTTLVVTSDRISVFDVVLGDEIPDKGRVLTGLSAFWFEQTASIAPNHFVSADPSALPDPGDLADPGDVTDPDELVEADGQRVRDGGDAPRGGISAIADGIRGRAMLVRSAQPILIECIARGYLFGGAWTQYRETGAVQGHTLPEGLLEAQRLPKPLFTPTTKATEGHDMALSDADAAELVGDDTYEQLREITLAIYRHGAAHAEQAGIILADTKLELGWIDGELCVIDEMMTPDSSRYWPAGAYEPGGSPPSFDKQYVRDHYLAIGWDQRPPAPPLPDDVIAGTRARYVEAYERITGTSFDDWYH